MNQLMLTLYLLTIFTPIASAQGKLEWSETKKLTIADFKGSPSDPSTEQTLVVSFGQDLNLEKSKISSLKTFNAQVTNYFSQDSSWIDRTDQSRLRYVITHFDINEWMARALRKRLNENRELVLRGEHQTILDEINNEFEKIKLAYDNESNYGNNPIGQMNWETRINEQLIALADYCKTCEPKGK
ncbi:MAG: hypothetical protein JNK44_09475 [Cyclobacteriaceae bacterium]|nr:hypothetical protein [Cyclobacteriaceae bacterium]